MTKRWDVVETAETDEGTMTLMRQGDEFVIRMQHYILMSSRFHLSEAALGQIARAADAIKLDRHADVLNQVSRNLLRLPAFPTCWVCRHSRAASARSSPISTGG